MVRGRWVPARRSRVDQHVAIENTAEALQPPGSNGPCLLDDPLGLRHVVLVAAATDQREVVLSPLVVLQRLLIRPVRLAVLRPPLEQVWVLLLVHVRLQREQR